MRTCRRLTLTVLVALAPACSEDKDPTVTAASAPTNQSGDTGEEGGTDAVTTGDDGQTSESSQTTQSPTTNTPTTADPSTTGMTSMTGETGETTTTANPTTADPTQTTQTSQTTADPTGDPDEAATQLCVDTINMYRATLGLPPYQRWTDAEDCSDGEAQSDGETQTPHGAFGTCGEFAQNECPGWPGPPETMIEGCLAQMWAEGPGDDFNMHGHYINMSSESYTQVACGYAEVNGEIWAVQNFR